MNDALFDAIQRLQGTYMMFPAFQKAFERMEGNLQVYRKTGVAQHLLVLGESGTGKTTLARLFAERYPRQVTPERDLIPVLYVSVPAAATIGGIVEAVLAQLGDYEPERGTISSKTARATRLVHACGVEMLLIDEAQHVQDRGKTQSQYFVGDWLKTFMDAVGLPVTLLGLPRTQSLLQVNEQLRRRFAHRLSLSIGQTDGIFGNGISLELFSSLNNALPLSLNPQPYEWSELGARFHFATHGRIAYVKQLLIAGYGRAISVNSDEISTEELAYAFTSSIWAAGVGALNPFDPSFEFRALDRAGEPFQQGEIVALSSQRRRN